MTGPLHGAWWHAPLLALQFLTRLPVPGLNALSEAEVQQGLRRAPLWFPLAGTLIGCITTAVLLACSALWPLPVAVLLALAFEAWMTGAFHEDAVADFADAMGGERDRETTLRIMKDSRIGSYGTVGLTLAIALRAAVLMTMPLALLPLVLIASACFGRTLAVAAMMLIPAPGQFQGLAARLGQPINGGAVILSALPGLLPLAMVAPFALVAGLGAAFLFLLWLRRLVLRRLGGVTGDCLGFAAYAGQIILLLAAAALPA